MAGPQSKKFRRTERDEELPEAAEDEGWDYCEPAGPGVTIDNVDNMELETPRVAISKYIPLIEFDADEGAIHFTTKLR